MANFLRKLFGGSKSEKDVKKIRPVVEKINQLYDAYKDLSNDELRAKTQYFKETIAAHLADVNNKITELKEEAEALPETDILGRERLYKQVDELKKNKDKQIEEVLEQLLPEAFAVVKDAARRFKEAPNGLLEATATDFDRELAVTKGHVTIEGDKVIYKNHWNAAGNVVTWNMLHYDVQLIGGIVLHQGKIAEMATGEGKTLVSTLPAYLNALAGEGVHIVTVNDYLARRDSEWNGPLFEWLGLSVDCIDKHQPNSDARKKAYNADITYGTNNEFGFDYLRDNMVHNASEMVQRKHHYAMVDEVDSVLIDDARTPLIISGPVGKDTSTQQFFDLKPRIEKLVAEQRKVCNQFLIDARKKIAEGKDSPTEGGLALFRAHRGLPKTTALIKFLSEQGVRQILQRTENYYLADQQKEMRKADAELFFYIEEKNNSVELTEKGLKMLTGESEDPQFFILPDIATLLSKIEGDNNLTAEEKYAQKEALIDDYSVKADRIHTIQQLLKAYTLFEKDDEYIVVDGQVKIVDEQTGRVMEGRRYSDGLHQAIEAKESVKIEATTQTYATVTLQNFFRMYHKLAGMTGTAETEAGEFWEIYKLDVVSIPTNVPVQRIDANDIILKTKREKFGAVINKIEEYRAAGRPVLVGTTSVEVSELLSRMLRQKQIPHNVLNAKQHAREAQIVAEAGLEGAVTIATNMAGRGTDIKLSPEVKAAGGLAIIGTERHESRRVDRQLRGRAGRQGDPGSSLFYVSLEDDLMRMFASERIAKVMDYAGFKEGEEIQSSLISRSIERAQKKVEENNFGIRKRLLEYDDVMNKQRTAVYAKRNHALFGERLALDIDNSFYAVARDIVLNNMDNLDNFRMESIKKLATDPNISSEELRKGQLESLAEKLYSQAMTNYQQHKAEIAEKVYPVFYNLRQHHGDKIQNVIVPFNDGKQELQVFANMQKTLDTKGNELLHALEKNITLAFIDEAWKEHLRAMDDLKQSVQTASYEQKDPLVIYKGEAFHLLAQMNRDVNQKIVGFLAHAQIPNQEGQVQEGEQAKTDMSQMHANQAKENDYTDPSEKKQEPVVRQEPKIGRNDPCPCGSGKKFKACHGK